MNHFNTSSYEKPNSNWYAGRASISKEYIHECIQLKTLPIQTNTNQEHQFAILGYACDKGVERNLGRVGAKDGPRAFRKQFGTLANHFPKQVQLIDVGSIHHREENSLAQTQENLAQAVTHLLDTNHKPIVIGGGHDIAYGHYVGINNYLNQQNKKQRIGIINFDAHLDLRIAEGGNSGTPFSQIAELVGANNFHYCAVGIRKENNPKELIASANELKATIIPIEQCSNSNVKMVTKQLQAFINQVDYLYVTVDLDGFSSAYAPGVSAPHPIGLQPNFALKLLQTIVQTNKVISIDFAELNPTYDIDYNTAKLASYLAAKYIEWTVS